MDKSPISKGVLDVKYANERLKKPELKFRYKVRALISAQAVHKYIKKSKGLNILDFGAAEGLTILELDKLIPESKIIGIEYSQDLINEAPTLPDNVVLEKGDVTNLNNNLKKANFDIVCALALLEHIPDPVKCIEQAKFALKKGGIFVATSPNPLWDKIASISGLLREDQHEIDMTKARMKKLPELAGLEVVYYGRFMWTPIAFLPYLNINVSPSFALKIDKFVRRLKIFNFLFVNQIIIAKKL